MPEWLIVLLSTAAMIGAALALDPPWRRDELNAHEKSDAKFADSHRIPRSAK